MRPDFAVLDANLRGGSSAPLARRLEQLGVPFCVCTGYRLSDLQSTYGDAAVVRKPIDGPALLSIIRAALDA
jgi:CheY-like chemotaxis protein